jgi:thiol-disulfide isomerase/thioredoxin
MSNTKIILTLCVAGLIALSLAAAFFAAKTRAGSTQNDAVIPTMPRVIAESFGRQFDKMVEVGGNETMPNIPVLGPDGEKTTLESFRGKPLLVNLWATWCAPCIVELPSLHSFQEHYKGRIEVVGIALELGSSPEKIKDFLEKREIGDFAAYLDPDGSFAAGLSLRGIPTSYVIASDGRILYRLEGDADWTSPQTKEFFDVFLLQNR